MQRRLQRTARRALSTSGPSTPAACRAQEAARADVGWGLEPRVAAEGAGSGSPRRARAAPRWVQVAPEVMEEPVAAEPDLAASLGARAPGLVLAPEPVLAKVAAARQGVPSAGVLVCVGTVGAAPDLAPLPDLAPVPEAAPAQAAPLAALRRGLCSAALKQGVGLESGLGPGSPACVPPATPRLLPSGWARLSRTLSPSPIPSPSSSAGKHLAVDGAFSQGTGSQGASTTAAGTEQAAPDARSWDSKVTAPAAAAGAQEAPHALPEGPAQGSRTGAQGGPSSGGSAGGGPGEGGAAGARSGALATAPDPRAPRARGRRGSRRGWTRGRHREGEEEGGPQRPCGGPGRAD